MLRVVGDAAHNVAAAEALGVLEGGGLQRATGLEVDQLEHDRGRPDVDREAEQAADRRPEDLAVVESESALAGHDRVDLDPWLRVSGSEGIRIRSRRRRTAKRTSRSSRSTTAWQASRKPCGRNASASVRELSDSAPS